MAMTSAGRNLMRPQEYFSELQQPQTPRSSFDRGCEILTTLDAGYLVPIYWDEVLPADTWTVGQNLFARITTLFKPLMDNLYLDIHWFFIPHRLTWTHWPNLMGEQDDPENPIAYTVPQVLIDTALSGGTTVGSQQLLDYMGVPTGVDKLSVSALFPRAYYKTYDDYYRDENLVKKQLPFSAQGDADATYNTTNFPLLKRAKRKDYFTSALPWAQKGTAPTLNFSGTAPITGTLAVPATVNQWRTTTASTGITTPTTGTVRAPSLLGITTGLATRFNSGPTSGDTFGTVFPGHTLDTSSLQVSLSTVSGFTMNAFREFATIQQYLELDARGGTRYVEHLYSFFGVQPEDARLQRAEYLGGQTFDLMVTPIAQTSESGAGTPQANLSGMGTFAASGHQFTKSFTEDGTIMAIASVRQEQRYQAGLAKKWSRKSRYDFYRPVFAHLGEMPIYNREIFAQGNAADAQVFGYNEAWADYRYSPSIITGKMRSNDPQSLDVWHLAQDPSSLPVLGRSFIEENPPMARVLAVTNEPAFIMNGRFNLNVARAMPMRSIPGLTRL